MKKDPETEVLPTYGNPNTRFVMVAPNSLAIPMEGKNSHVMHHPGLKLAEQFHKKTQSILKYTSLLTLTVQNAALNLTMRMARTQKVLFISSTAVVMSEILKLVTCLGMVYIEEGSTKRWAAVLHSTVVKEPIDTFKVAIPSMLYVIQNNLIYVAATHLDAATCQVTYQLKILTTAILSVFMLKKKLVSIQWVALLLLFMGVALVQVAQIGAKQTNPSGMEQNPFLGLLAIIAACFLSGFAGVYFEKILKGSDISVWIRNVQLSTFSIPLGLLTTLFADYSEVNEKGFFHGYNTLVWFVILLQAVGGLVVAMVVKHADNIMKGFATSMAIVLSCVISIYAFNFNLTGKFFTGACLVIASIFMYSKPSFKPVASVIPKTG